MLHRRIRWKRLKHDTMKCDAIVAQKVLVNFIAMSVTQQDLIAAHILQIGIGGNTIFLKAHILLIAKEMP